MRYYLPLFLLILLTSCADQVARRPVTKKSGSFVDASIQRNRDLIIQEEKMIVSLIKKDTSRVYEASSNGFWYTYLTKNDTLSKPTPVVGDLVLFNYNLETLTGQELASRESLGNSVTQIDQSNQELITGIREGLKLMREGESVTFLLPSHKAYGYYGLDGVVGSNMPIRSTVTLLEIKDQSKN